MATSAAPLSPKTIDDLRDRYDVRPAEFEIQDVTMDVGTATASVENTESQEVIELGFVKEGDEWKLSSFPGLETIQPPGEPSPPGGIPEELAPPGGIPEDLVPPEPENAPGQPPPENAPGQPPRGRGGRAP